MKSARPLLAALVSMLALLPAALSAQPATYYAGVVQNQPASIPATQVVARYVIPRTQAGVNDFSGIATRDGTTIYMVSDRGYILQGRLQRGYGQSIDGMQVTGLMPLLDENGQPLPTAMNHAQGLSMGRDGSFYVAFEEYNRVTRYRRFGGPATELGAHADFDRLRVGRGLESVAVDRDGSVYSIPEMAARATYGFPSYRYNNGQWEGAFRLPSDGSFLPVGADFGPDGRLYVLETEHSARGFRSQVRRFTVRGEAISQGDWVMRSNYGQFGNLEGLSVFRDWNGRIRMLMVSDDQGGMRGQSELVDVAVNR